MIDKNAANIADHVTSPTNFAMHNRPSYAKDADRILYNWSGLQYISDKSKIIHPRSEEELASIVKRTRSVRIIGTALSYEAISSVSPTTSPPSDSLTRNSHNSMRDDVVVISLQEEFIGLKSLDLVKNTATFLAATSIDEVISILAKHGQMMTACPGVIGVQTLAGSIATGTHGQGLYQSDYADMVQSFRIVLANGTVRCMTPADPLFNLYLISIGTFGIITEIEISIRPRLLYTCTKFSSHYDQFVKNYIKWNQEAEFAKVWWFPETNMCQVWLVNPANEREAIYYDEHNGKKQPSRTLNHIHHSSPPTADFDSVEYTSNGEHGRMDQTIRDYIEAMARDTQVSQYSGEPQFRTLTRFMNMQTMIGWNEQLVTKGIPVPQINCEISVPLGNFQAATEALHKWNRETPGKLHYPFIYRVAGKSKALMSASHRGPVVWIGFLVYISQAGTIRNDGMSTMYQLQRVLAPFGGLPHWGKHFHPELFEMVKLYTPPIWHRFRQEMRSIDPSGKFTSPFLWSLFFGPAPGTSITRSKL